MIEIGEIALAATIIVSFVWGCIIATLFWVKKGCWDEGQTLEARAR